MKYLYLLVTMAAMCVPNTMLAKDPIPSLRNVVGPLGSLFDFGGSDTSEVEVDGAYFYKIHFHDSNLKFSDLYISRAIDQVRADKVSSETRIRLTVSHDADGSIRADFSQELAGILVSGAVTGGSANLVGQDDYSTEMRVWQSTGGFLLCALSDIYEVRCFPFVTDASVP
ncbi:MAG: hypothetical protein WBA92_06190 [Pseudorhodobacter sp.]